MGEPKRHIRQSAPLPSRAGLGQAPLAEEGPLVQALIEKARFSEEQRGAIATVAADLVKAARAGRRESGGVDSFLHEYGLSSEEGVLLLCLAEALLRIPDAATADRLIAGTIGSGDWSRHLGQSESLLVNASTWGLMLTGHLLDWSGNRQSDPASMVQRLVARSGEPVIRQALRQAMRILGNQFVLGETIEAALANAEDEAEQGYRFSFDMLGEAARSADDARALRSALRTGGGGHRRLGRAPCGAKRRGVDRPARAIGQTVGAASALSAVATGSSPDPSYCHGCRTWPLPCARRGCRSRWTPRRPTGSTCRSR